MKSCLSIRSIVIAALSIFVATLVSSCGTISGMGRDVKHLGSAVEEAAR